ncbi:MAG: hypothetical protein ACXWKP_22515 [Bradyrhizobium sp.]
MPWSRPFNEPIVRVREAYSVHAHVGLLQPIAFFSAVIFASSVAVIRSWSLKSSSIDIESSTLCFMKVSDHELRYHEWKKIL